MAALYINVLEAGELCLRDHELGTYGSVVVELWVDGRPTGEVTTAVPSFPRAFWNNQVLHYPGGRPDARITLVLLDKDPLQSRGVGRFFCFGWVDVPRPRSGGEERQPRKESLQRSQGNQGFITYTASFLSPAPILPAVPPPVLIQPAPPPSVKESDFCGVLLVALGHTPCRTLLEVSVGACSHISWHSHGPGDVRHLLVVDHNPTVYLHATMQDEAGTLLGKARGEVSLSRASGPNGLASAVLEANLLPVTLSWVHELHEQDVGLQVPGLQAHLRFFPAEFLWPGGGGTRGVRFKLQLLLTDPEILPLVVQVPAACFGSGSGDASFVMEHMNDTVQVCLADPVRLVGRSMWRVVPLKAVTKTFAERPAEMVTDCFIDVLALRLPYGSDRTMTVACGTHSVVLRAGVELFDMLKLAPPGDGQASVITNEPDEPVACGHFIGFFVHSLAVHSPVVSQCLLTGGPHASVLFGPLPHCSARKFIVAEPDPQGRIHVHALLPEYGVSAFAETLVGDGPLQLHWNFSTAYGDVLAGALISCVRWPAVDAGLPAVPLSFQVLREQVPESMLEHLFPLHIKFGTSPGYSFRWSGAQYTEDDIFFPLYTSDPGFGTLEVCCGSAQLSSVFFAIKLVTAQDGFADKSVISLPILYEKGYGSIGDVTLVGSYLLPVHIQMAVMPVSPVCGVANVAGDAAGVLLLQSFRLCALFGDEGHNSGCPLRNQKSSHMNPSWEPSAALSMSADQHTARGTATVQRACGSSLLWGSVSQGARCIDLMPHILKLPFSHTFEEAGGILPKVELQLCCAYCGSVMNLIASPRKPLAFAELKAWRSFDVYLDLHATSFHSLHSGAVAAARFIICTSPFVRSPEGLLAMHIAPLKEGDPGIAELLMEETAVASAPRGRLGNQRSVLGGLADSPAAFLRLGLDAAHGEPAGQCLIVSGEDSTSAERLYVQTTADHLMRSVVLEIQMQSGARRLIASVGLAVLGPLGAGNLVVHPLLLSPRLSFKLLASFEPRQVGLAIPGSVPKAAMPQASDAYHRRPEAELASEIDLLRQLEPSMVQPAPARPIPARRHLPRPKSADARSKAKDGRTKTHPYLERGVEHLWLAPKVGAAGRDKKWHQELDRKRPSSQPRTSQRSTSTPASAPKGMPPGWDDEREAEQGQLYRLDFINERKREVTQLREQLSFWQVEARKVDQQLAHVKQRVSVAEKGLGAAPEKAKRAGIRARPASAGALGRNRQSSQAASSDAQAESSQVCSSCGRLLSLATKRYCERCLPEVEKGAKALQDSIGGMLLERSALRYELRRQQDIAAQMALRETALVRRSASVTSDEAEEQAILELLSQLKTQLEINKTQAELDERQLSLLEDFDYQAEEQAGDAHGNLAQLQGANDTLRSKLERVYEEIDNLLRENEAAEAQRS